MPEQATDPLLEMTSLAVDTGISDLATNIDHYLYGIRKWAMPDRPVFLDTNGWSALLNSSDTLHAAASKPNTVPLSRPATRA